MAEYKATIITTLIIMIFFFIMIMTITSAHIKQQINKKSTISHQE